jgi:hypothetical protein
MIFAVNNSNLVMISVSKTKFSLTNHKILKTKVIKILQICLKKICEFCPWGGVLRIFKLYLKREVVKTATNTQNE